jgi:KDO2-lipid IV(A) lauroyltransferase
MSRDGWRDLRSRFLLLVLWPTRALLGRSSLRTAQAWGRLIGRVGWRLSRRDRRRTLAHLEIAFPELPAAEREAVGRRSFVHLGMTGTECLHLMRRDCAAVREYVDLEGWEHVEAVRSSGRPLLLVTGHCGNWELLASAINCRGLGMAVIARGANDARLGDPILDLRKRFGTETINRAETGASRRLLTVLREGGALGMLIDQDTPVKGVWVPFFGRPAYTPVGAAELALKRGAGVVPCFIARQPDGRHRAVFHPELELPADPTAATALMTAAIEAQVRAHPEQWVWLHRRWRRQPAS